MSRQVYIKFLSRKSIVSLIGIDYAILQKTDNDNISKFYLSGFLVVLIMIISFLSVFYAFELMFSMWHAELLLSSFFSLMFFNIYIFLIQTFSKEVFPTTYKIKFFNLSNLSRIGFVLLIGFLIAQPVKIFFVRHQLDNDIVNYKEHLYNNFCKTNTDLYKADINKLTNERLHYTSLGAGETSNEQVNKIETQLSNIQNLIDKANTNAYTKIHQSNFFIKRIEFAGKYSMANFILFVILAIFCAPIALIYSISGNSRYYTLKKHSDKNLVKEDYERFKQYYSELFRSKHKIDVEFYEPFANPPFNTIRKPVPEYRSQDDFFNNLIDP